MMLMTEPAFLGNVRARGRRGRPPRRSGVWHWRRFWRSVVMQMERERER